MSRVFLSFVYLLLLSWRKHLSLNCFLFLRKGMPFVYEADINSITNGVSDRKHNLAPIFPPLSNQRHLKLLYIRQN